MHIFFKIETFLGMFFFTGGPRWSFVFYLLLHGCPESSAAGYLSQHGQVQEPGPKLDLNQSLYSMAQFESGYDQAEVATSLSLPPER